MKIEENAERVPQQFHFTIKTNVDLITSTEWLENMQRMQNPLDVAFIFYLAAIKPWALFFFQLAEELGSGQSLLTATNLPKLISCLYFFTLLGTVCILQHILNSSFLQLYNYIVSDNLYVV